MTKTLQASWLVLRMDLLLANRHRGAILNPLFLFIIVVSLFPLAVSPEPKALSFIAPGVIWVAALLAMMLSLANLFREEYADGSLEQLLLSPHPLPALALAKVFAHWLMTGLPLLIIAPILATLLSMPRASIVPLVLSLLLGTPTLLLIGAIGAALVVSLKNNGLLLMLLILPLSIPVLIFGVGAVTQASAGLNYSGQLDILGAMLMLSISLAPMTIASALRIGVS